MSAEVDIKQLAIVRDVEAPAKRLGRPHVVSRYVIPGALVAGFLAIVFWALRDSIWPPQLAGFIIAAAGMVVGSLLPQKIGTHKAR